MSKSGPRDEGMVVLRGELKMHHGSGDDQQRFLRYFLAHEREVLRTVIAIVPNLEDARDVVQQAALVLWEKFSDYDPARPFAPWACGFAANLARQWLARRKRWQAVLEGGFADELIRRRTEMMAEMDQRFRHLDRCIGKLPEDQRELIDGYYQQRTPIDALALNTGRTAEAVYKALQRIRAALRSCIERSVQAGSLES